MVLRGQMVLSRCTKLVNLSDILIYLYPPKSYIHLNHFEQNKFYSIDMHNLSIMSKDKVYSIENTDFTSIGSIAGFRIEKFVNFSSKFKNISLCSIHVMNFLL